MPRFPTRRLCVVRVQGVCSSGKEPWQHEVWEEPGSWHSRSCSPMRGTEQGRGDGYPRLWAKLSGWGASWLWVYYSQSISKWLRREKSLNLIQNNLLSPTSKACLPFNHKSWLCRNMKICMEHCLPTIVEVKWGSGTISCVCVCACVRKTSGLPFDSFLSPSAAPEKHAFSSPSCSFPYSPPPL